MLSAIDQASAAEADSAGKNTSSASEVGEWGRRRALSTDLSTRGGYAVIARLKNRGASHANDDSVPRMLRFDVKLGAVARMTAFTMLCPSLSQIQTA